MTKRTIEIGGMTCGHCVGRVSAALKAVPGIIVEQVKVGSATVVFDEAAALVDDSVIAQAIEQAGYQVLQAR
jgi:copper chaperone